MYFILISLQTVLCYLNYTKKAEQILTDHQHFIPENIKWVPWKGQDLFILLHFLGHGALLYNLLDWSVGFKPQVDMDLINEKISFVHWWETAVQTQRSD